MVGGFTLHPSTSSSSLAAPPAFVHPFITVFALLLLLLHLQLRPLFSCLMRCLLLPRHPTDHSGGTDCIKWREWCPSGWSFGLLRRRKMMSDIYEMNFPKSPSDGNNTTINESIKPATAAGNGRWHFGISKTISTRAKKRLLLLRW